jgi:hypothetical protein
VEALWSAQTAHQLATLPATPDDPSAGGTGRWRARRMDLPEVRALGRVSGRWSSGSRQRSALSEAAKCR